MFQYKSNHEQDIVEERRDLIWQMLTAQLEASHRKLMEQYGMQTLRPGATEADSLLRGPGRKTSLARSATGK